MSEDGLIVVSDKVAEGPNTTAHDDQVRKWLALGVIAQFMIIVGGICGYLIFSAYTGSGSKIGTDIFTVLTVVVTAEIGYVKDTLTYYYGSSSGSTAKNVAQEKSNK